MAVALCAQSTSNDQEKLQKVRAYYETAQRFEREDNWSEAEKTWRAVLDLAGDDARAWTNLGVALNRKAKPSRRSKPGTAPSPLTRNSPDRISISDSTSSNRATTRQQSLRLQRTLSIEPQNEGARRALALALVGSERFREATREIAQLLARVASRCRTTRAGSSELHASKPFR